MYSLDRSKQGIDQKIFNS